MTLARSANEDARRFIEKIVADRFNLFRATVDPLTGEYLDNPHAQLKSLSEHVAADYHGRCLVELIQNGNDAHSSDRSDGEIEVLLADEEPFGTVYVANRGQPFSEKQVGALLRTGKSSKPPGEAIGNKGLGFRSVSHLCDAPEIYSQSSAALARRRSFDGFCFTLEHGSALRRRFDDGRIGELAERDLPMFSIPRWLNEQPERVRAFAERGFASVIRLVLRDEEAHRGALREFHVLMSQSAPTLVFMERLCRLTALVEGAEPASPDRMVLKRSETRLRGSPLAMSVVSLGDQGTFLLIRGTVPEPAMKRAIAVGVAAKQLHGSWEEWSGDGEVALAVRMDHGKVAPRLYTFLPMSDGAAAPFHGYLHGSFFPTSSRKAIDSAVELNRLLLEEAATLAAATVRWLAEPTVIECHGDVIDVGTAARAAADLLAWAKVSSLDGDYGNGSERQQDGRIDLPATVAQQVAGAENEFADAAIVPCLGVTEGALRSVESIAWCSPRAARSWGDESETFTVACLAEHGRRVGIAPIWPGLGEGRTKRLVEFLAGHAEQEFLELPTPDERAEIAELAAKSLRQVGNVPVRRWKAFYRDLVGFMDDSPRPLAGRQIILCGDGMLRSGQSAAAEEQDTVARRRRRRRRKGEKVEASLFFPPVQLDDLDDEGKDDGLKVPAPLRAYFAFALETLPWHGELKGAREFLEDGLVSPYDGETVLTRISQVVNSDATTTEAIAGLRWAFAIWRRAGGRLLGGSRTYRLRVPTIEGAMIPATDAVFSESWPDETRGKRLQEFLDVAPRGVADLVELGQRRLAPTSHRAFRQMRTEEWMEFLCALGVNRGLLAIEKKTSKRFFKAQQLTSFAFCDDAAIPKAEADKWKIDVERSVPGGTSLGYTTDYSVKGPLWWLPGQADHESFSDLCRELYAALVVEWLDHAPGTFFSVQVAHRYYTSDTRRWPTPVAAFLRRERWMPADDPQATGAVRGHFAPCDVWISGASGERFPYYLRQPAVALARAIERTGDVGRGHLVAHAGLRVLGERSTLLEQARFLANQYRNGTVNRHYEPQFINLYSSTWRTIADLHATDAQTFDKGTVPEFLVVRRRSELLAVSPGAADTPPVCVRDNDDEVAPGLIGAADQAMLEVKGADPGRVGALFHALYGDSVRLVSGLHYDVRADNMRIDELPRDPTALDVCGWLRPMAACAIEALTGTAAGQLPTDRSSLLARLGNVGLWFAADVDFVLNGTVVPFTGDRRAHLFRRADATPIVVAQHVGPVNWDVIEDCLPAICDAINLPQIAAHMRILVHKLSGTDAAVGEERIERSNLDLLGRALYLDEHALSGAQHLLGDQLEANVAWMRAVVHLVGGADALDSFDREIVGAVGDPDALRIMLEPLLGAAGISAESVIDACQRSFTLADLRERLEFPLASFNESLEATGNELETYPELQADQMRHYVTDHEVEMIQALRNKVAAKLDGWEPAPEYVELRDEIRSIAPDLAWLPVYKDVPREVVASHAGAWLAEIGAPPLGENPGALPPLQAVREANRVTVASFAKNAAPLVRTWCDRRGRNAPEVWTDQDMPDAGLRDILEANGIMDFRELAHVDLLKWCAALGLWPQGMEETLDRRRLRIETTDIEAANAKAREEAEKREASARSVRFNGRDEDPKTADWMNISDVIAAELPRDIGRMPLGRLAALGPVAKQTRGTGTSPPGPPSNGGSGVPQAKKDMIGRLGEIVVYHWLNQQFEHQDIDAAWVSKNGDAQLGRSQGSDDFGYDFRVVYRRQTWQIEVKASVGDQQRFVMGETEVRAAREAARPRSKTRYVVVYVANPHDPANVHIDVLPNPMGPEADGVLDLLGEGVRFGFKRR